MFNNLNTFMITNVKFFVSTII